MRILCSPEVRDMVNLLKRPLGKGRMEAQEDVLRRLLNKQVTSDGEVLTIEPREHII